MFDVIEEFDDTLPAPEPEPSEELVGFAAVDALATEGKEDDEASSG